MHVYKIATTYLPLSVSSVICGIRSSCHSPPPLDDDEEEMPVEELSTRPVTRSMAASLQEAHVCDDFLGECDGQLKGEVTGARAEIIRVMNILVETCNFDALQSITEYMAKFLPRPLPKSSDMKKARINGHGKQGQRTPKGKKKRQMRTSR